MGRLARFIVVMTLSDENILRILMKARPRIAAAAWVVVRDTHAAEDIFQNVALKAVTKKVVFEAEGAVLSWAFITARREGIDWLRRHRRELVGPDPEILAMLEHEWATQTATHADARRDALHECLESASESSRKLLRLRYAEGRSCSEVAGILGAGLNAVYKRLSRLHKSLGDCIARRLAPANGGLP